VGDRQCSHRRRCGLCSSNTVADAVVRVLTEPRTAPNRVTVERRELPPIPTADRTQWAPPYGAFDGINQFDTYAVVRCGDMYAEIQRFAYWQPGDDVETVEVTSDARLHDLPGDGPGVANVCQADPSQLFDLAQLALNAALILDEVRHS
jgi:hypothetical protein